MKKWILIAALVTLGALSASAGWKVVAEVTAGGDAKELAVNRTIRTVQIECTDGTVVVNTVVIREGAAKESVSYTHLDVYKRQEVEDLIERGIIGGGMLPKISGALKALKSGVRKTHIIDAALPHSLLLELFTDKGIGTEIIND